MGTAKQYIRAIATNMIGELGITLADLDKRDPSSSFGLYEKRREQIVRLLRKMKPETLGRIMSCGRGFPETPHDPQPDGNMWSLIILGFNNKGFWQLGGRTLLREYACAAIVAEMVDVLDPDGRFRQEVFFEQNNRG